MFALINRFGSRKESGAAPHQKKNVARITPFGLHNRPGQTTILKGEDRPKLASVSLLRRDAEQRCARYDIEIGRS
jgi:hypothetical protein